MNQSLSLVVRGCKASVNTHMIEIINGDGVSYICHYSVIINLTEKKNKLISLYRRLSGEWLNDLAESDEEMIDEIKKQIELKDADMNYSCST